MINPIIYKNWVGQTNMIFILVVYRVYVHVYHVSGVRGKTKRLKYSVVGSRFYLIMSVSYLNVSTYIVLN